MALSKRIFIFYLFFVVLCGYFMVHLFSRQVYPSIRQTTEETLVDTANFFAEVVTLDFQNGALNSDDLAQKMVNYQGRNPKANIWGMEKQDVNLQMYITDHNGIVLFDSTGIAVGEDYSNWRDVNLTLRGEYGARSTSKENSKGEKYASTMFVGAPIYQDEEIIGVLTVSKSNQTADVYIDNAKSELVYFALILFASSLILGAILSWWLGVSFRKLIDYAKKLGKGEREIPPKFYGKDLNVLTSTLSNLRAELDGKEYIENYVNTLTHELKSPLSAIRGASELLQGDLDADTKQLFIQNIDRESERLQNLIDRVLRLSMIEQTQTLESPKVLQLSELLLEVLESFTALIQQKSLIVEMDISDNLQFLGDPFLMKQALLNIIHNAIDFMPENGVLKITAMAKDAEIHLNIFNEGSLIPEYALIRLYERFYSLPRPDSGEKSTGLGLNFVKEVIALHQGEMRVENRTSSSANEASSSETPSQVQGVNVEIILPRFRH
ncbi:two-component system sensor histidine kinase CreC [Ignatzschineria sp. LJL83]